MTAAARPPAGDCPVDDAWLTALMADLFPLSRSITGDGTRATLARVRREIALTVHEVPTGTSVLDWSVPEEWNLRRARLIAPDGSVAVDTADSNLHVVGYSTPVRGEYALVDLLPRLHSLPSHPELVPYRTSYHVRDWGFCLSQQTRAALLPGRYGVEIDTSLAPGSLSYGELLVPGRVRDEVLITTHICHPSLANDNLTGIAAATVLARWAVRESHRHTYRFLFLPATIGAVTWLARNQDATAHVRYGLVLTGLGDPAPLTYKSSRRGNTAMDRLMSHLVTHSGGTTKDWYPYGYDERQFCSPGFDLPVGRLSRAMHGTYPQYHTSADDLSFVSGGQVRAAVAIVLAAFDAIESGLVPRSLAPYGEPQLGRRGLFRGLGGTLEKTSSEYALLWLLSLADGEHDLVAVAERSGLTLREVMTAAEALRAAGLLA